ncbi:MAG: IS3 family transposase [Nocardioides sp.]
MTATWRSMSRWPAGCSRSPGRATTLGATGPIRLVRSPTPSWSRPSPTVHEGSRGTYGSPRVHAELRLGLDHRCGRKRVARLMRANGLVGVGGKRKTRATDPTPAIHDDLVQRRFVADAPDRLWCTDVTEHPTGEGKVYCCARAGRVLPHASWAGRSLITCAPTWSWTPWRWPAGGAAHEPGTIVHSDRGSQYTSWVFGHRLRAAGLLGSMGRVASSVDNGMIESFWSTMQRELLDRRTWTTRDDLATAIFEWIEAFYNPVRRHSALGYLSPAEYETRYWTTLTPQATDPAA